MRNICVAAIVLSLAACATTPPAENWFAYREQVERECDQGKLTPLQGLEKIQAKYRKIYGPDPEMDGAFAYGKQLYRMADAGRLSADEADALATARLDEILTRQKANADYYTWLANRFPPDTSD
jgi:hypothetical protein